MIAAEFTDDRDGDPFPNCISIPSSILVPAVSAISSSPWSWPAYLIRPPNGPRAALRWIATRSEPIYPATLSRSTAPAVNQRDNIQAESGCISPAIRNTGA